MWRFCMIISQYFLFLIVNVDENIRTEQYNLRRNICDQSMKKVTEILLDVISDNIKNCGSVNQSYNRCLKTFLSLHNECFPKIKSKLKPKKHFCLLISLVILIIWNSSKIKQRHYEKLWKKVELQNMRQNIKVIKLCLKQQNINLKEDTIQ